MDADALLYEKALSQYAAALQAHITSNTTIPPGKVILHPVDEPNAGAYLCVAIALDAIKAGGPALGRIQNYVGVVRPWEDPVGAAATALADIVTPVWKKPYHDGEDGYAFYRSIAQSPSQELWTYGNGSPFIFDPTAQFRLLAWHGFDLGSTGYLMWSYADRARSRCWRHPDEVVSSSAKNVYDCTTLPVDRIEEWNQVWNQYPATRRTDTVRRAYSPVFFDAADITSSKYWEALREGIEDHHYLRLLRQRVAAADPSNSSVAAAADLLDSIRAEVIDAIVSSGELNFDKPRWEPGRNVSLLDDVRRQALTLITALK